MTQTNKWTAFLLSACVPGAGQLAAKSWTCLVWFGAAGLLVSGGAHARRLLEPAAIWVMMLQIGAGFALSVLSAENAKRLLETKRRSGSGVERSLVQRCCGNGRNLDVLISLTVSRSQADVWSIIRDLPRFLTIDPFHDAVTLMRDQPAVGVDLVLSHNAFGWRFLRFGRIVAWHEGSGYTFSDLSPRGPRAGFPHVFIVKLEPIDRPDDPRPLCQLTVRVRGRWGSRLIPVSLGRLWVWLVCREHARLLRQGL